MQHFCWVAARPTWLLPHKVACCYTTFAICCLCLLLLQAHIVMPNAGWLLMPQATARPAPATGPRRLKELRALLSAPVSGLTSSSRVIMVWFLQSSLVVLCDVVNHKVQQCAAWLMDCVVQKQLQLQHAAIGTRRATLWLRACTSSAVDCNHRKQVMQRCAVLPAVHGRWNTASAFACVTASK